MESKKNILAGNNRFKFYLFVFLVYFFFINISLAKDNTEGSFTDLKILDKVSSKNYNLKIKIGEEKKFKNILIKSLKCRNSEFDDNPEITAYIQVKDLANKNNDKVFIFNGWTFSSSPAIQSFDHPVYDIWLIKCFK